ncbi:hypothetical protein AB0C76_21455 [Kitasatospora sp. NPDC048722]|uniref:hypothetical protein n=1 Tax=Kitasatospora sp. NPDC048722 TaxID=3155639 RepID=UPI0033C625CA
MTDGEWWRKSGPWSARSGGESAEARDGSDDSVYDAATAPGVPGMSAVPLDPPREPAEEADPDAVPPPQVIHSGGGGWDLVMLNFSDAPAAPPKQIPEQRAAEGDEPPAQPTGPQSAAGAKSKKARKEKEAARAAGSAKPGQSPKPPKKSALAGRRPSPLLLLASALLAGGAWTGFFPAMLAGWGLGYLSSQLKDLTRKFAIFGIPLITMSATTLYQMRQTQHGQAGAGPGSQLGQMTWASAPGVLRLSAALTAAFLLLMALRRKPQQEG